MNPNGRAILTYLETNYPRFVSVAELIQKCYQTDVRKRVSEMVREGLPIEKKRNGKFIMYRSAGWNQ